MKSPVTTECGAECGEVGNLRRQGRGPHTGKGGEAGLFSLKGVGEWARPSSGFGGGFWESRVDGRDGAQGSGSGCSGQVRTLRCAAARAGRGRTHVGWAGEVRGTEPGRGGASQWAAASSAPGARAAFAPFCFLAKARTARGGEREKEPPAPQPPSGHEDGRGLRQNAAAVGEPGPGISGGRGGGGRRPMPQPQRARVGGRAAAGASAAAAAGPASAAAERAHLAEEARRRCGPGTSYVSSTFSLMNVRPHASPSCESLQRTSNLRLPVQRTLLCLPHLTPVHPPVLGTN
ncbi:collagen alpha-1(I) chain-like [Bubalus kerabau]|uniref:collagen alpha-1(I) chain-like n=1 Tax=Bubalus carabanensis TaxID=3119969 RepID=UPI00244ECE9C|nr:collagen alpha-1(I) chain-like [Bubalus carabanensis]